MATELMGITPAEYRDAFRECMLRLLDYETSRKPGAASQQLQSVIERDATAQARGD